MRIALAWKIWRGVRRVPDLYSSHRRQPWKATNCGDTRRLLTTLSLPSPRPAYLVPLSVLLPAPFEAYSQPCSSRRPPPLPTQLQLQQCRSLRPGQAYSPAPRILFSPSTSHPLPFLTFTSIHPLHTPCAVPTRVCRCRCLVLLCPAAAATAIDGWGVRGCCCRCRSVHAGSGADADDGSAYYSCSAARVNTQWAAGPTRRGSRAEQSRAEGVECGRRRLAPLQ
jgi:hypothetical protein